MNKLLDQIRENVTQTQVWKSIFRHGYPNTDANRALVMFSNVILHLHPVRVRRGETTSVNVSLVRE